MTQVTRRELFPGVWLRTVHTDKFKSSYLSLTMLVPWIGRRAAANALLFPVLRRGTREHPDMESLSAALDELYGGAIEPIVRKRGRPSAWALWPAFWMMPLRPGASPSWSPRRGCWGSCCSAPAFRTAFCGGICVRGTGQSGGPHPGPDQRQALLRHPAPGTADVRGGGLRGGQAGDVEHAAAVTPGSLWERYQQLLSTAQIELYYCGSAGGGAGGPRPEGGAVRPPRE